MSGSRLYVGPWPSPPDFGAAVDRDSPRGWGRRGLNPDLLAGHGRSGQPGKPRGRSWPVVTVLTAVIVCTAPHHSSMRRSAGPANTPQTVSLPIPAWVLISPQRSQSWTVAVAGKAGSAAFWRSIRTRMPAREHCGVV